MSITVAGAPVSFGVFELTPDDVEVALPDAEQIATILQRTGYRGIDAGPVGLLGRGDDLVDLLRQHELELCGGWIDLPFSDDDAFAAAMPRLEDALAVFATAAASRPARLPLPTLADSGDERRRANPGGGPGLSLDEDGWERFARNLASAAGRIRDLGLEPTFHHHACTFVETPDEIEEFLARTDVGLTFDTGHILIGGGDPMDGWLRWHDRINHLHLKDVQVERVREIVARKGGMIDVWSGGAFAPLGEGDLDIARIMDLVTGSGYDGWLVIEQDLYPQAGYDLAAVERDHITNREALMPWA